MSVLGNKPGVSHLETKTPEFGSVSARSTAGYRSAARCISNVAIISSTDAKFDNSVKRVVAEPPQYLRTDDFTVQVHDRIGCPENPLRYHGGVNSDDSFLDFTCPYCGELVSYPADSAGLLQDCINCGESLIVPESAGQPGKKLPFPIRTPRLIIRRFESGDCDQLMKLAENQAFIDLTGSLTDSDEESVQRWLQADAAIKLTSFNSIFYLAVVRQEDNLLIGHVGLELRDWSCARLHATIHKDYQRKGFGAEAATGLIDACFQGLKLHRLTASCDSDNTTACRFLEKLGMRREGEFVKDRQSANGTWVNTVWYAALEEEYLGPDQATSESAGTAKS